MDKKNIINIILLIILAIAVSYITIDKVDFCETVKNESYSGGFNQGVEYWNTIVIYQVNNNGVIPYWFNNSYYELNIAQLCGDKK